MEQSPGMESPVLISLVWSAVKIQTRLLLSFHVFYMFLFHTPDLLIIFSIFYAATTVPLYFSIRCCMFFFLVLYGRLCVSQ